MSVYLGVTLRCKSSSLKKVGEVYEGTVSLDAAVHDHATWEDLLAVLQEFDVFASQDIKTQVISALQEEKKEREQAITQERQSLEDKIRQLEEDLQKEREWSNACMDTVREGVARQTAQYEKERRVLTIRIGQLQERLRDVVDSRA